MVDIMSLMMPLLALVFFVFSVLFLYMMHKSLQTSQEQTSMRLIEVHKTLEARLGEVRIQVSESLQKHSEDVSRRVDLMTHSTAGNLKDLSRAMEVRLDEGLQKSTSTFVDIMQRLAIIDEAQKKIAELSGNVVSLQEILSDKRARGAFGEAQLSALIGNVLPASAYTLQATFPNGSRPDCVLHLPEPTGDLAIDAKFPLEAFRRMLEPGIAEHDKKDFEKQFKQDIKKHINDIASKYIIPSYTSDGAMMFIPAESVFAEIHAHHPDLVEEAHKKHVWMASPTTLMAILTTARAALKDAATRQHMHLIQSHLGKLSEDFKRFQKRMDNLATHIRQANDDVSEVSTTAQKIVSHFHRIERVELGSEGNATKDKLTTPLPSEMVAIPLHESSLTAS
jgi:DNA recombination protein RmuC